MWPYATWEELAAWASGGYRALGFLSEDLQVAVEPVSARDPGLPLDDAARAFALELLEVAPRTDAETRWILRRALGLPSAGSPEAGSSAGSGRRRA